MPASTNRLSTHERQNGSYPKPPAKVAQVIKFPSADASFNPNDLASKFFAPSVLDVVGIHQRNIRTFLFGLTGYGYGRDIAAGVPIFLIKELLVLTPKKLRKIKGVGRERCKVILRVLAYHRLSLSSQ